MSVTFHCNGDGCDASAPPGTVTGGMPPQWTVKFVYEADGSSKRCVRRDHYCDRCKRRSAEDASPKERAKPRATPKRGARKKKLPPESDDDQGALF